jgi:Uma2 family endonuclease
VILYEPELHCGNDVLVPDLAGWRRARLPNVPAAAYLTLPPDWICEVLSTSPEALDRGKKLRVYAREGVAHARLVAPLAHTLEVLSLEAGYWTEVGRYEGDAKVRAAPFDAIELELAALRALATATSSAHSNSTSIAPPPPLDAADGSGVTAGAAVITTDAESLRSGS